MGLSIAESAGQLCWVGELAPGLKGRLDTETQAHPSLAGSAGLRVTLNLKMVCVSREEGAGVPGWLGYWLSERKSCSVTQTCGYDLDWGRELEEYTWVLGI